MVPPRAAESRTQRLHRFIEHYTPDGTLGRLLFAACTGGVSPLAFALVAIANYHGGAFWFFLAPLAAGVGLAGGLLAIVTLWPVYLSLIGNIQSPRAYSGSEVTKSTGTRESVDSSQSHDAIADLKRRYAAGDITEAELDQRVENLLHVDDASSRVDQKHRDESAETGHERERN